MYRRSTLNKTDGDFIALANSIMQQCTQHAEDWHIDASRLSELNVLTAKANTAYEIHSDRSTRNIRTTAEKNAAFDKLKRFLSIFINYLECTLTVPDEAIASMCLRPRNRHFHEPIPAPSQAPAISVAIRHGQLKVYAARPAYEHATHGLKPPKYHGFKLRWRFEDETEYHYELSTRLHCSLNFDRKDETRRIILEAAWINPRLETGPWSIPITEVVC